MQWYTKGWTDFWMAFPPCPGLERIIQQTKKEAITLTLVTPDRQEGCDVCRASAEPSNLPSQHTGSSITGSWLGYWKTGSNDGRIFLLGNKVYLEPHRHSTSLIFGNIQKRLCTGDEEIHITKSSIYAFLHRRSSLGSKTISARNAIRKAGPSISPSILFMFCSLAHLTFVQAALFSMHLIIDISILNSECMPEPGIISLPASFYFLNHSWILISPLWPRLIISF